MARQFDGIYITCVHMYTFIRSNLLYIHFIGPFTAEFRGNLVKLWQDMLIEYEIPHTAGCNLEVTLSDPVRVRYIFMHSILCMYTYLHILIYYFIEDFHVFVNIWM